MPYLLLAAECIVVGGLLLIQPYVVRRGLLFGVHVGEQRWDGEAARTITRRWTRGMVSGVAGAFVLGALILVFEPFRAPAAPVALLASTAVLLVGSYALYLRAYFEAKGLAEPGAPPSAAALVANPPYSLVFPLLSLVVALLAGSAAVVYAWAHYGQMPPIVPTHFGPSGRPDAWSPRSFWTVMLLPLGALAVPASLAGVACLTARAKRAVRIADRGVSVAAQARFRQVTASFLGGAAILTSTMMAGMAVAAVRTALGLAAGLPAWTMAMTIVLVGYAVLGSLYIAVRLGQGGARLERQAAGAPLTNGVADNSRWYLGGFYVNRDDPSFLVEKRFGIGYTINFGNPKAVALLVAFLAVIAVIVVSGLLSPQTRTPPVR